MYDRIDRLVRGRGMRHFGVLMLMCRRRVLRMWLVGMFGLIVMFMRCDDWKAVDRVGTCGLVRFVRMLLVGLMMLF